MTDDVLSKLKSAVSAEGGRTDGQVTPIQTALANAQQALADVTAADVSDKAGLANAQNKLSQALSDVQAAADEIERNVNELSSGSQPQQVQPQQAQDVQAQGAQDGSNTGVTADQTTDPNVNRDPNTGVVIPPAKDGQDTQQ